MLCDIHNLEFSKTRSNSDFFEFRALSLCRLLKPQRLFRTNSSEGGVELRGHVQEEIYQKRLNPHIDDELFSCQSFEFLSATSFT